MGAHALKGGTPLFSVARLRVALAVSALVLLAVVGGFIGYARYRVHRELAGLKNKLGKLGMSVTQESDNVTFSQSWQGRKVYSVRAAKQLQHGDGQYTLHDVGIVLYGKQGDRADAIHGNEFEYDQKKGVMHAVGDVFIDLAAPAHAAGKSGKGRTRSSAVAGDGDPRILHLKTSGLVFREKERTASTDATIEFRTGGLTGTATGADYDSNAGVVVLRSDVEVSGLRKGRPMLLTAAHAELDRVGNVALLEGAKLVSKTDAGVQTASADHAAVLTESDGTPQRVDAEGHVVLRGTGRGTVTSERMQADLNGAGVMKSAHLSESVRYIEDAAGRQRRGKANDARLQFDAEGRPVHATMAGAVEAEMKAGSSSRRLESERLELALTGGGKEKIVVRGAEATGPGGARLRMVEAATGKVAGTATTDVRADVLRGRFSPGGAVTQIAGLDGNGKTVVERTLVASAGVTQWKETATGNVLKLDFRSGAKGRMELATAEQRGAVTVVREALTKAKAGKAASMDTERAEGEDAVYEASANRMRMTGRVKLADAESALFAERVEMDRATGDATAEGGVKVSYRQAGAQGEPVHVLADRAVAHKLTGISEFFGNAAAKAKMWQGGSQVDAPEIVFDRTKKTVTAEGASAGQVLTVLVDAEAAKKASGPVRVVSREMTYTDGLRQVEFRGPVRVEDRDGVMRAGLATVYLAPVAGFPTHRDEAAMNGAQTQGAAQKGAGAPIALGGRVERMVAQGAVEIEQPGRKATGDKVVYTASDGLFELTGTKSVPPKMVDETQGTVTGVSLRFRSGDDSVEVLGGDGRAHSEARMNQKN